MFNLLPQGTSSNFELKKYSVKRSFHFEEFFSLPLFNRKGAILIFNMLLGLLVLKFCLAFLICCVSSI